MSRSRLRPFRRSSIGKSLAGKAGLQAESPSGGAPATGTTTVIAMANGLVVGHLRLSLQGPLFSSGVTDFVRSQVAELLSIGPGAPGHADPFPPDDEIRFDDCHQQTLLNRARTGCAASHAALLAAQLAWIVPWFERELPVCLRSKFDADDLAQEAHIHAWLGLGQFKGGSLSAYRGWLEEICRHCLADVVGQYLTAFCREVTREVPLDERALAEGDQRPFHRRWSGEARGTAALEAAEEVERLLAGLPRRARQVVLLHVFEELSFCEIARRIGCCARTVRRDWAGARGVLRARLLDREA